MMPMIVLVAQRGFRAPLKEVLVEQHFTQAPVVTALTLGLVMCLVQLPLLLPLTVAMATVIPISAKTAPLAQETVVPVPLTMVIVVAAVAVIVLATTALGLTNVTLKVERQVARGHVLQEAIAQREP